MNPFIYSYILTGIIILLIIIKTVHFINHKSRNWKFKHWFYFGEYSRVASTNESSAHLKTIQNRYSRWIAILTVIDLIYLLYLKASGNL